MSRRVWKGVQNFTWEWINISQAVSLAQFVHHRTPQPTAIVAANYKYTIAIAIIFELEAETYIEDIPFDTFTIANNCHKVNSTKHVASEIKQDDLCCK